MYLIQSTNAIVTPLLVKPLFTAVNVYSELKHITIDISTLAQTSRVKFETGLPQS